MDTQSVVGYLCWGYPKCFAGYLGCGYPKCFRLSGLWILKVFSAIWVVDTQGVFGYLGCGSWPEICCIFSTRRLRGEFSGPVPKVTPSARWNLEIHRKTPRPFHNFLF